MKKIDVGKLFGLEHISTGLFLNGLKSYSQMKLGLVYVQHSKGEKYKMKCTRPSLQGGGGAPWCGASSQLMVQGP